MNIKKFSWIFLSTLVLGFAIEYFGGNAVFGAVLAADKTLPWAAAPIGGIGKFILISVIAAASFAFIFLKGYQGKGWMEGIRFGIWITLISSVVQNMGYSTVLPIQPGIGARFILVDAITFIVCGIVAALIAGPSAA